LQLQAKPIKISLYPTVIEIAGYEPHMLKDYEKRLSLYDVPTHHYTYYAFEYDEDHQLMKFPAGIDADRLVTDLRSHYVNHPVTVTDYRKPNVMSNIRTMQPVKMKYKPRDNNQAKAINFLTFNTINNWTGQRMLCLQTGEGKTYCAVNTVVSMHKIPIVFVNMHNLASQWKDKIQEYTSLTEDQIYIFSGGDSIRKFLAMTKDEKESYQFFIGIYKTLAVLLEEDNEFGMDLQELFIRAGISIKIFDEAHVFYQLINNIDLNSMLPSYYLTATPKRGNFMEDKVFQQIFYKVNKYKGTAVHQKYVNVIATHINTKPTEESQAAVIKDSKHGFAVNTYNNILINNERMFSYYYKMLHTLYYQLILNQGKTKRKTAILFNNIDVIDKVTALLKQEKNLQDLKIYAYHGKIKKKDKEEALEQGDLLVTTGASLGKGMDVKDLEAVISCINSSSSINITQIMGRLRYIEGKELYYLDLVDHGYDQISVQYKRRLTLYRKKAKSINEVTLPENEQADLEEVEMAKQNESN